MKRIAFLIAFAFTAAFAAAQTYYPMPSAVGTPWRYRVTPNRTLPAPGWYPYNYYTSIIKDTVLNSIIYHDVGGFAYREANKKVYIICYDSIANEQAQSHLPGINGPTPTPAVSLGAWNNSLQPLMQEVETLDFNLNVGDTIHTGLYSGSTVRWIYSLQIEGSTRRVTNIQHAALNVGGGFYSTEEHWVEGVGVGSVYYFESGYGFDSFTSTDNAATPTTQLAVSPNPARDHLNFHLPRDISAAYTVDIYDVLGMLRSQQAMSSDNQTVSTAALPSGAYFCRVRYDGKTQGAARFVIAR